MLHNQQNFGQQQPFQYQPPQVNLPTSSQGRSLASFNSGGGLGAQYNSGGGFGGSGGNYADYYRGGRGNNRGGGAYQYGQAFANGGLGPRYGGGGMGVGSPGGREASRRSRLGLPEEPYGADHGNNELSGIWQERRRREILGQLQGPNLDSRRPGEEMTRRERYQQELERLINPPQYQTLGGSYGSSGFGNQSGGQFQEYADWARRR